MPLRITNFIKLDGQEIGMFIMQEPDLSCFKIQIFAAEETLCMLLRKKGTKWENMSQDTPKWADALIPGLVNTICQRFFVEFN